MGKRLAGKAGNILTGRTPARLSLSVRQLPGGNSQGRRFHESWVFAIEGQQRFHFPEQFFIPGAGLAEERRALTLGALQRGAVQLCHLLPALRLHSSPFYSFRATAKPWRASNRASPFRVRPSALRPLPPR